MSILWENTYEMEILFTFRMAFSKYHLKERLIRTVFSLMLYVCRRLDHSGFCKSNHYHNILLNMFFFIKSYR